MNVKKEDEKEEGEKEAKGEKGEVCVDTLHVDLKQINYGPAHQITH